MRHHNTKEFLVHVHNTLPSVTLIVRYMWLEIETYFYSSKHCRNILHFRFFNISSE